MAEIPAAATASPRIANGRDTTRLAFVLVTSVFFLCGLSYGLLDLLNKHFQESLNITRARSALLQGAYFGAYFLMALPAALLMRRYGYKTGSCLGWGCLPQGLCCPCRGRALGCDARDESAAAKSDQGTSLWQRKHFTYPVVAQFFYVAAQVGAGAFFINYVVEHAPGMTSEHAAYLFSVALGCFLAGRFLTTAAMGSVSPARLLTVYAVINVMLCALVVAGIGWISIAALIAVFFSMSIMFPTIFALGVKGLGGRPNVARHSSSWLSLVVR